MLRRVPLSSDFRAALDGLPGEWTEAGFVLRFPSEADAARAAALLGGLNASRHRETVRFTATRRGAKGPDVVARALTRLEREGLTGELELAGTRSDRPEPATPKDTSLADEWDREVAALPPDWSDVYAEIELGSTDYLERAALLLSPLNPARDGERAAFCFRCAQSFGYGASPGMVRRCLERADREGITGSVRVLRALSDTKPWATQGPVWYVGGKPV
jgi:hypothetical protein